MVKTPNRPTVRCKSQKKTGFKRDIPFFWDYILEKKTLTSLVDYSTSFPLTGITFQNKDKYSTQYNYSILQLEYFLLHNFTKQLGSARTLLGFLRNMLQLDRPEAVSKYKLIISISGIKLFVFRV